MTWGTDCPQCGKPDCKWVRGPICDGNLDATIARLQREHEAMDKAGRELLAKYTTVSGALEILQAQIGDLQRELEAVRGERDALREALDQIKGGSFPGASLLALGGNWKAFAEALQAIAASALSQPVQPVEDAE